MIKRRKRSNPIRLKIRYEPASEMQRKQAIMLLASMYRDVAFANALRVTRGFDRPDGASLVQ